MGAQGGSATNVVQLNASGRREAKIVAAARVLSIDYRSIVENAVAGLADNTPDTRREVYAQARDIVKRHLRLMRLPEPIVDLEKFALDLTIKKVERQWEAREAAETAVPPERDMAAQAHGSPERALAALGTALRSRHFVPGLRPVMASIWFVAKLLRPLANPVGIAVALPVVASAILFIFFVDNTIAYRSLVDGPAGRWLSGLYVEPSAPAPGSGARKPDRIPSGRAARAAAASARVTAVAEPPPQGVAVPGTADRGPTRVGPIRAEFAVALDAPAACGSGLSISERIACADDTRGGGTAAEPPEPDTQPAWLADFATLTDAASGRAPATPSIVLAAEAAPRDAPPPAPRAAPIRPINAKVTALIDSGKRAILKGDLERAVRDFGEAIRIDPKYPDSYLERGQALFKLGETERAIADYSAAIARDPQHGAAFRARGMAYLYRGTPEPALADLSKTIDLAERDPSLLAPIELFYARRSRGSIYDSKQQYDLEIADCTALIESYARDPILVEALKANYGDAGAANILATIHRQRANAHIRRSNWEGAVADLTEAIPLSSDRGYTTLIDRSKLYEGLGLRDQAVADVQAALGVRPGSEEARLALKRLGAPSRPLQPKGF